MPWTINSKAFEYKFTIHGFSTVANDPKYKNLDNCTVYPDKGILPPESSQTLEICYTPCFPHHLETVLININSGKYLNSQLIVSGMAISSALFLDKFETDFGVLRVGSFKSKKVTLRNNGMLKVNYYIEFDGDYFDVSPEEGVLDGGAQVVLTIRYYPTLYGKHQSNVSIFSCSTEVIPKDTITFTLSGESNYPDLYIQSNLIDFNIALYQSPNSRPLLVENRGSAEASITYKCKHPCIEISSQNLGLDGDVIIPALSQTEILIIYTPEAVETLDSKLLISSKDEIGDTFLISLKGSVGIPRLLIKPDNIMSHVDFGVVRLNKSYEISLYLVNDGTIYLNYDIRLDQAAVTAGFDRENSNEVVNVLNPFTVTPQKGGIGVGEQVLVKIEFQPKMLYTYEYDIFVEYDFQVLMGRLSGIGGRGVLSSNSPLSDVDFGICRIGRKYKKSFTYTNFGNLGFWYVIIPKDADANSARDIVTKIKNKECSLQKTSNPLNDDDIRLLLSFKNSIFTVSEYYGYCAAGSKLNLSFEFKATEKTASSNSFKIYYTDRYEEVEVHGLGAAPDLYLLDKTTDLRISCDSDTGPPINLGIHPVHHIYVYNVELVNSSSFGSEYMIQPTSISEFDVYPRRGFIESGHSAQLQIFFEPSSENIFQTFVKIIWEGKFISAKLTGTGGVGRLQVVYPDQRDQGNKALDFGMIPFQTSTDLTFFLLNSGLVGIRASIQVENDDYTIAQFGDSMPMKSINYKKGNSTKTWVHKWDRDLEIYLAPNTGIEVGTRFTARSSSNSIGDITIRSDSANFLIPLRGRGGTINLSHKSDLEFGDVSCSYTYARKITIMNSGSIPATLSCGWLVVGHSSERATPFLELSEAYTLIDPRSKWSRQYYCELNHISVTTVLKARQYWAIVKLMVRRRIPTDLKKKDSLPESSKETVLKTTQESAMHVKRRGTFFRLISTQNVTSQSTSTTPPFIRVSPEKAFINGFNEVEITIELNLATEDTFLATLVLKTDIPNTKPYEITLSATPKLVNICCDDTRMLNFYRQPIGDTELIMRSFKNVGHKDVPFKFTSQSSGLSILPNAGVIKVGQTLEVTFAFQPLDESVQSSDIIFEPSFSQPIKFKMFGGGGYSKASISRHRRFDFGHCMISKDTISYLPITNEGNAILHLIKFEIQESSTFFPGPGWPKSKVSIHPQKTYSLPIIFSPQEESPITGKLLVGTKSELFEIDLIGVGREAVLIIAKMSLDFNDCIIGNTYHQKLNLKNIGDVNYPVQFQLEPSFNDIEFYPTSLMINPFSEIAVNVTYKPSHQTQKIVTMTIASPYSTHKVPISLHSGFCRIDFGPETLDFGLFEKSTKPTKTLTLINSGTVKSSFSLKDIIKPALFHIVPAKGSLLPNASIDVTVTHVKHEVASFEEHIIMKTDLADKLYKIPVMGRCEETLLKPQEFSMINLGICPVLDQSSKMLEFKNYGKFPLVFDIKCAYPLKVSPLSGQVEGNGKGVVQISWNPSGAYELRSQMTLVTNVGKYHVLVRGKSIFPELYISTSYIDFGVCAKNYPYKEKFTVENRGKVPLKFNIPPCKDSNFSLSITNAQLAPKETQCVEIMFMPNSLGKITSNLLIECKGIHYKEIILVGHGGDLNLEYMPQSISLGRCPFELPVHQIVHFNNLGDVAQHIEFTKMDNQNVKVQVPDPFVVPPNRTAKCQISFGALQVGHFEFELCFKTRESKYTIPITGFGIKINLSERSLQILKSERLKILSEVDPMDVADEGELYEASLRRFTVAFNMDMKVCNLIESAFLADKPENTSSDNNVAMKGSADSIVEENENSNYLSDDRIQANDELNKQLEGLLSVENITIQQATTLAAHFTAKKKALSQKREDIFSKDKLVNQIINDGRLSISDTNLSSLLSDVEPITEADLSPLLCRPLPIPVQKKSSNVRLPADSKNSYTLSFPKNARRDRNAVGNPFE